MSEPASPLRDEGARLLQSGDFAGALAPLQQAVAANPSDWRAQAYLGVCQARRGDYAAAVTALQEAARLQPADAGVLYNLALALFQSGRLPDARAAAERVLALNPSHQNARDLINRIAPAAPPTAPPSFPGQSQSQYGATPEAPSSFGPPQGQQPLGETWTPAPPPGSPEAGMSHPRPNSYATPNFATGDTGMGAPFSGTIGEPAREPTLGQRLLRGWGWGIVYGQWWTLWLVLSAVLFGRMQIGAALLFGAIFGIGYGFFGSVAGLVIGALDMDEDRGPIVGIAVGMVCLLLEVFVLHTGRTFFSVIWYFFTGRYIGQGIARKVQAPG